MMEICYAALSETGLERNRNEDAVFCGVSGTAGVFLVADGMGGHEDGARASRILKENVESWWRRYINIKGRREFSRAREELKSVLEVSNKEIIESTRPGEICGSTAVLLWILENAWAVFSCGDSRCYRVDMGRLKKRFCQLTTDDVWENQHQNVKNLSKSEICNDRNFGRLTRAVGVNPNFYYTLRCDEIKNDTVFALCSDGVYQYCPEALLKKYLRKGTKREDLNLCLERIKNVVYQNGAPDNVSLVLVRVSFKKNW